jgi:hypothetical protein
LLTLVAFGLRLRCRLCCRGDTLRFRARVRRDTLRLGL